MGHDPQDLLKEARFPTSPPPERLPLVDYARLVGVVARTLDDEYLGLLDGRMPFGTFALQAAYARHGADLLEVYERLLEISRILDLSLVQTLEVGGGEVVHRVRRIPKRIVRNDPRDQDDARVAPSARGLDGRAPTPDYARRVRLPRASRCGQLSADHRSSARSLRVGQQRFCVRRRTFKATGAANRGGGPTVGASNAARCILAQRGE